MRLFQSMVLRSGAMVAVLLVIACGTRFDGRRKGGDLNRDQIENGAPRPASEGFLARTSYQTRDVIHVGVKATDLLGLETISLLSGVNSSTLGQPVTVPPELPQDSILFVSVVPRRELSQQRLSYGSNEIRIVRSDIPEQTVSSMSFELRDFLIFEPGYLSFSSSTQIAADGFQGWLSPTTSPVAYQVGAPEGQRPAALLTGFGTMVNGFTP